MMPEFLIQWMPSQSDSTGCMNHLSSGYPKNLNRKLTQRHLNVGASISELCLNPGCQNCRCLQMSFHPQAPTITSQMWLAAFWSKFLFLGGDLNLVCDKGIWRKQICEARHLWFPCQWCREFRKAPRPELGEVLMLCVTAGLFVPAILLFCMLLAPGEVWYTQRTTNQPVKYFTLDQVFGLVLQDGVYNLDSHFLCHTSCVTFSSVIDPIPRLLQQRIFGSYLVDICPFIHFSTFLWWSPG